MKSALRIPHPLPEMKLRAVQWLWLVALALILNFISGCASTEPDNASVRPWNTPTDWQNGMSGMNYQHP